MTPAYTQIVQRWQQQPGDALLIEGEWVAGRIAQAVENEAHVVMEMQCGRTEESAP